jgi:hypothetical protein
VPGVPSATPGSPSSSKAARASLTQRRLLASEQPQREAGRAEALCHLLFAQFFDLIVDPPQPRRPVGVIWRLFGQALHDGLAKL